MTRPFLGLAIPLVVVGIIATGLADNLASLLIPIVVIGGVILTLRGAAKGFERADRRRNR